MPETLPGSLLEYKAMAWRRLSANGSSGEKGVRWKAEIEDESFGVALQRNLKRPFIMLVKEPILAFFSIYLTGKFTLIIHMNLLGSLLLVPPLSSLLSLVSSLRSLIKVVYTCLYGLFNSYPIVFTSKSLSPTQTGLTFIPVMVGFFLLYGLTIWHFGRYRRLWKDAGDGKRGGIEPEERLIPCKSRPRGCSSGGR
jgi:DHA1 family multidrug resistance protein-like MFS transporter